MTAPYNVLGFVRLRVNAKVGTTGHLSVPVSMMKHLTIGTLFKPEFTEDGILFRHVGPDADISPPPPWAKDGDE